MYSQGEPARCLIRWSSRLSLKFYGSGRFWKQCSTARASRRLARAALLLAAAPLPAQDASVGIAMPITASADAWATHRRQKFAPQAGFWDAGFRAAFYPGLKLGPHWFAYSAIQVNSFPLFYYQAYYPS